MHPQYLNQLQRLSPRILHLPSSPRGVPIQMQAFSVTLEPQGTPQCGCGEDPGLRDPGAEQEYETVGTETIPVLLTQEQLSVKK